MELCNPPMRSELIRAIRIRIGDAPEGISRNRISGCYDTARPLMVPAWRHDISGLLKAQIQEAQERQLTSTWGVARVGVTLISDAGRITAADVDDANNVVDSGLGPCEAILRKCW
jgi:hypothetical protein